MTASEPSFILRLEARDPVTACDWILGEADGRCSNMVLCLVAEFFVFVYNIDHRS